MGPLSCVRGWTDNLYLVYRSIVLLQIELIGDGLDLSQIGFKQIASAQRGSFPPKSFIYLIFFICIFTLMQFKSNSKNLKLSVVNFFES